MAEETTPPDTIEVIRWPDGTLVAVDEFREEDWSWKSDDYERIHIPLSEYE